MYGVNFQNVGAKDGCTDSEHELTKYIVKFYLNKRMIFACKNHNNKVSDQKKKQKRLKKILD